MPMDGVLPTDGGQVPQTGTAQSEPPVEASGPPLPPAWPPGDEQMPSAVDHLPTVATTQWLPRPGAWIETRRPGGVRTRTLPRPRRFHAPGRVRGTVLLAALLLTIGGACVGLVQASGHLGSLLTTPTATPATPTASPATTPSTTPSTTPGAP